MTTNNKYERNSSMAIIAQMIFWSRWLQAPLYLGLIAAQGVYVFLFMKELLHLVAAANTFTENEIMLICIRAYRCRHDREPPYYGDHRRLRNLCFKA